MFNSSTNSSGSSCSNITVITKTVIPLIYCLIFMVGLLLNGVAAWIFLCISSEKSFIVYLKNIVVADLLMSLTFPFKILADSEIAPPQLNTFVCRYSAVVFYANMYIGITFFGLIGFDRYYKIVKPLFTSLVHTAHYSKVISVIIWILIMFITLPNMILTNEISKANYSRKCIGLKSELGKQWHKASSYICTGIFWVVFLLLIIFYTSISKKIYSSYKKFRRNSDFTKRKTSRNIFTIMFVFVLCFVPYHFCRIPYTLSQTSSQFNCHSQRALFHAKEFTLLLSAANVCLDPIIYFFLCQPFRERLYQKLHLKLKTSGEADITKSRRSNTLQESMNIL
ncbi:P2Y purinoceptor 14 [Coturnix japonica]|uniref:Purinergic receptor P2Y14 n=1 Tax=Coturnix japonica TaxID=93934 RepID=A0A8C2U5R6_COTJA|nr:P2Y purinoceptor 14 [Coturnix japonica]XP_015727645.1 P2Y purinoceptor 14 [Coturnix japonica]